MGTPFADIGGMPDRVQVIDLASEAAHKPLDVSGADQLDTLGHRGPIDREGCGPRAQTRVPSHEAGKPLKGSVGSGNVTVAAWGRVAREQLLLAVLPILLGSEDSIHTFTS